MAQDIGMRGHHGGEEAMAAVGGNDGEERIRTADRVLVSVPTSRR